MFLKSLLCVALWFWRQNLIAPRLERRILSIHGVGPPCPDTILPTLEGIPRLEAERIACQHEPGDGSPQVTVIEKINQALAKL